MNNRILFLFTINYPFGHNAESIFIKNEIPYLITIFNKIYIIPKYAIGELDKDFNHSLIVDPSYSKFIYNKYFKYITTIFSMSLLYKELLKNLIKQNCLNRIYYSLKYLFEAIKIKEWMKINHTRNILESKQIICYTYWNESRTLGLGLLATEYNNITVISRAHGIDLYEDRKNGYIPFRYSTLRYLDKLILISKSGYNYMITNYPQFKYKYHMHRLGIKDCLTITKPSTDNIFRIVSCSRMEKVKRIDLLLKGLTYFARINPDLQVEWKHFGGGSEFGRINWEISNLPVTNLVVKLYGQVNNEDLIEYYKNNPIDIFINTSESEGIPVSIMEAQNFGIPAVAPTIGGLPEIVNNENGYLLSNAPNEYEIANTLKQHLDSKVNINVKKNNARSNFLVNFNAEKNYPAFIKFLNNLMLNDKTF